MQKALLLVVAVLFIEISSNKIPELSLEASHGEERPYSICTKFQIRINRAFLS
jgi:hypothetical protein